MGKSSRYLYENKLKNPVYCKILFLIGAGEVSLYTFAEQINKNRRGLLRQFAELEEEGYLNKRKQGKKYLFSINWDKIIEEFFALLSQKIKMNYDYNYTVLVDKQEIKEQGKNLKTHEEITGKRIGFYFHSLKLLDKKRIKNLENNKYFKEFIKQAFCSIPFQMTTLPGFQKQENDLTAYHLFEQIIVNCERFYLDNGQIKAFFGMEFDDDKGEILKISDIINVWHLFSKDSHNLKNISKLPNLYLFYEGNLDREISSGKKEIRDLALAKVKKILDRLEALEVAQIAELQELVLLPRIFSSTKLNPYVFDSLYKINININI